MNRRGTTSRKRLTLLTAQILLIQMMTRWWDGLNGSRTKKKANFGNKEPEKYGFDITKADKIFDLLLLEGQIKLKPYHKIPTDQELKNIKYCKWHNATSHDTNECKVFRQQIQSAIE